MYHKGSSASISSCKIILEYYVHVLILICSMLMWKILKIILCWNTVFLCLKFDWILRICIENGVQTCDIAYTCWMNSPQHINVTHQNIRRYSNLSNITFLCCWLIICILKQANLENIWKFPAPSPTSCIVSDLYPTCLHPEQSPWKLDGTIFSGEHATHYVQIV